MDRRRFISCGGAIGAATAVNLASANVANNALDGLVLREEWLEFSTHQARISHLQALLSRSRSVSRRVLTLLDDWVTFDPSEERPYQAWALMIENDSGTDFVGWEQTFIIDPDIHQIDQSVIQSVSAEQWVQRFNPVTWEEWLMVPFFLGARANPILLPNASNGQWIDFIYTGAVPTFSPSPVVDFVLQKTRGFLLRPYQLKHILWTYGFPRNRAHEMVAHWCAVGINPVIDETPAAPVGKYSLSSVLAERNLDVSFIQPESEVALLLRRWASQRSGTAISEIPVEPRTEFYTAYLDGLFPEYKQLMPASAWQDWLRCKGYHEGADRSHCLDT